MSKRWIAFANIIAKDIRAYYLKPPNISWGLIFPIAWAGMFLIRTGRGFEDVYSILGGAVGIAILFGTTSMLAVIITFERRTRSFERLIVAPIPIWLLMLSKITGAVMFGVAGAFVPILLASFIADLSGINWLALVAGIFLTAIVSGLIGLIIAISVREVFEAQTISNLFRFPMVFLCGLFFPREVLPLPLRVVSYGLPLTYGVDILKGAIAGTSSMPIGFDVLIITLFCVGLFIAAHKTANSKLII